MATVQEHGREDRAVPVNHSKVIVVLGSHRSGTSAVTGVLKLLGVDLGSILMPAGADNSEGFFEDVIITNLQQQILSVLGSNWNDFYIPAKNFEQEPTVQLLASEIVAHIVREFKATPLWGFKDPRTCRLLPLWMPIFKAVEADPLAVIVIRSPHEVAQSLIKRNGMSKGAAYLQWLLDSLAAEFHSRGLPRVFITYDELLANCGACVNKIENELKFSFPRKEEGLKEAAAFLNPKLKHQTAAPDALDIQLVGDTYNALLKAVAHNDHATVTAEFDALAFQFHTNVLLFTPAAQPRPRTDPLDVLKNVTISQARDIVHLSKLLHSPSARNIPEIAPLLERDRNITSLCERIGALSSEARNDHNTLAGELRILKEKYDAQTSDSEGERKAAVTEFQVLKAAADETRRKFVHDIDSLRADLAKIMGGSSYKLGRLLTAPFRWLKNK